MANEKRLIDANELLSKMHRLDEKQKTDVWLTCDIEALLEMQPTIDAVEVKHGRCNWCNGDYHTKIMATAIRYHSNGNMDGYEMKVNYCPNCGADMRERKDNERKAD